MNERIDKLIEQCTTQQFSDCVGGYENFDKEKFAELLIRECAGIVEDAVNHREPASTYVDKIKQHFGVK